MTAVTVVLALHAVAHSDGNPRIDRRALVKRHNVVIDAFDGERPLQVGNGEFAFGMDITGLQTFAPFNTMSHWGWHSGPLPAGQRVEDFKGQVWDTHGRPVRYPMPDPERPELSYWLAGNPHRINLGRVGLVLIKRDHSEATVSDLESSRQTLDLWTGVVTSQFKLEGEPVTVTTACHPAQDAIGVMIQSPLIRSGRIAAFLACPGNDPLQFANFVGDWRNPGRFEVGSLKPRRADLVRKMDGTTYYLGLKWQGDAELQMPHRSEAPLHIVKAVYGARDTWVDVTDLVVKAVHDGRIDLPVGNSLGGDPIKDVQKQIKVTYNTGGRDLTVQAREGENLFIEADPGRDRMTLLPGKDSNSLSFVCAFSPHKIGDELPGATATISASRKSWPKFWQSGGALDLSGSTDPRWIELERRVVLSQYLMAVNEAGSYPPQESGLVNNGWFGRFHMEMVWWHAAHWLLWNRFSKVDRSLGIYSQILKQSEKLAKSEGYQGARWPKCIGPDGREWPHEIHSLLIWQQPHPIFFAELDYRAHPTRATLLKWQPIVAATADFMASYAFLDKTTQRYVLGPPLFVASENVDPKIAVDPTFELGYWRFGLRTAQKWRERLRLEPKRQWQEVLGKLAPLPVQDGVYVLYEGVQDMWTKWNFEHPALIGTLGMLPGDGVDRATMARTLEKIRSTWNFDRTWGWDFPMLAMCAARLGKPDEAIDFLLTKAPGFQFDARGLATGGPFPYFPSNGGLLYAVAMMAAGWDGSGGKHAPGFPQGGRWKVRFEGLNVAP